VILPILGLKETPLPVPDSIASPALSPEKKG
jgi:ubiquinol-cytochrome c reductase cytochrome b subunit